MCSSQLMSVWFVSVSQVIGSVEERCVRPEYECAVRECVVRECVVRECVFRKCVTHNWKD